MGKLSHPSDPTFVQRLLADRLRQAGVLIPADALERFVAYFVLLRRWNARINLTGFSLEDPSPAAIDRLLVEPAAAARHVPTYPLRWVDVGSGGGSPALPLKILRPSAALTMVEVKARKTAFLREAVRMLGLKGAAVVQDRFEAVAQSPELAGRVDLITVRAVRVDADLLGAAAALLSPNGRFLAFVGTDDSVPTAAGFALETDAALPQPLSGAIRIWRSVPRGT